VQHEESFGSIYNVEGIQRFDDATLIGTTFQREKKGDD
jgi:hypothetical protein